MSDQDYDENPNVWSKEEVDSINQCADVLQLRHKLLQKIVWHLQHIDNDMMENSVTPDKIDGIVVNIHANGEWFSTTETRKKPIKLKGNRFKT